MLNSPIHAPAAKVIELIPIVQLAGGPRMSVGAVVIAGLAAEGPRQATAGLLQIRQTRRTKWRKM
tara:strand:+ start:136 stop:330 length:195 start_codon:yes stop_codon:yes gene_type:complete